MGFKSLAGGPFLRKRKRECFCVLLALLLSVTGFVILSSASLSFLRSENYALKQLAWSGLALGAFGLMALTPTEKLRKSLPFWVWLSLGLLLAVLIPGLGTKVNGSRRWIYCILHIQVSELAKIALILWLADYIEKNAEWMDSFWKGFFKPILFCSAWAGLVLVEPDYGTAVLLLAVAVTLLFLGGAKIRHLLLSAAGFLLLFALLVWHNPPRLKRIISFLDLEGNRSDGSYQLWQAILAFVSGGPWGRGIGHGRQQLTYLPEAHTDFIYAVLVEELGCIGGMLIIGLFLLLFLSALSGLRRQESIFARTLGYGAIFLIIYQSILNMGVVTACFPTKGIPLPFLSYGGSNLITVYALLGLMTHALRPEGPSSEGGPAGPSSAGRSLDF
ncbi:MAG: FtsW/RodA/SpoVE family cell cycle protein [Puniceicoccales bacterium]|jgi:cell division protein FtsW|nr:FtsW/RodA/SpoVE family cell cycle protein [Puniceicoccales bacterium]